MRLLASVTVQLIEDDQGREVIGLAKDGPRCHEQTTMLGLLQQAIEWTHRPPAVKGPAVEVATPGQVPRSRIDGKLRG